ncbi:hypothetical protein EJB05_40129, partial [Eragrostis curvula]
MVGDDDRVNLSPLGVGGNSAVAFGGASVGDAQLPTQARVFGAPTRGDGGETSQRRRMFVVLGLDLFVSLLSAVSLRVVPAMGGFG